MSSQEKRHSVNYIKRASQKQHIPLPDFLSELWDHDQHYHCYEENQSSNNIGQVCPVHICGTIINIICKFEIDCCVEKKHRYHNTQSRFICKNHFQGLFYLQIIFGRL